MAIWRGSVSPSRSTRTGAFMLIGGVFSLRDVLCASTQDTLGASAFSCRDYPSAHWISAHGHEFQGPRCITLLHLVQKN